MAAKHNTIISNSGILSQHELYRVIGDQLTPQDVDKLLIHHNDMFSPELRRLICDGYTFFLASEAVSQIDTSEILQMLRLINRHDLAQFVNYRRRKPVEMDPVDLYLEQTAKSNVMLPSWMQRPESWMRLRSQDPRSSLDRCNEPQASQPSTSQAVDSAAPPVVNSSRTVSAARRKRRRSSVTHSRKHKHKRSKTVELDDCAPAPASPAPDSPPSAAPSSAPESSHPDNRRMTRSRTRSLESPVMTNPDVTAACSAEPSHCQVVSSCESSTHKSCLTLEDIKKKVTCDIRLRVRAEYCFHDNALDGNIFSNKPELIERQFERFMQANTILKSRDLGSIICDIKFSELTYLDAFWRDYINGSLLEALKGVFITESLKQAVGHEAIKLLVNVDEDDYESGRFKLLQNLKD